MLQSLLNFCSPSQDGAAAKVSPAAQALGDEGKTTARAGKSVGEADTKFSKLLKEAEREGSPKDLKKLIESLSREQLADLLSQLRLIIKALRNPTEAAELKIAGVEALTADHSAGSRLAASMETRPPAGKTLLRVLEALADLFGGEAVAKMLRSLKPEAGTSRESVPLPAKARNAEGAETNRESGSAGKARIVVLDLRKGRLPAEQARGGEATETEHLIKVEAADTQDKDFSVLFRGAFAEKFSSAAPGNANQPLQRRVLQSFQERFVPEVVKQTGIILKDGGNGEIRLVLRPENLGIIRIRLALSESSLEGRIVVENNSVRALVESNLDSLKNALREEGFQTTSLEVSVGNRQSWDQSRQDRVEPADVLQASWSSGSEEFEKAVPLFLDLKPEYSLVNLVV